MVAATWAHDELRIDRQRERESAKERECVKGERDRMCKREREIETESGNNFGSRRTRKNVLNRNEGY